MKHLIIILSFLLPVSLSAQLLRSYGVVEIGSTFPTSSSTGAKLAYRTTDSSFYRWIVGNTWVKIVEPSIDPDTLYLKQLSGTTAIVDGDTIDISTYLLHSDTASMLTPYIRLAGYGLSKLTTHTLQVDTNLISTKIYTNRFLLKSDTASMLVRYIERGDTLGMLSAYIRSAGWGLLKSSYTLRADSTLLATKLYTRNLPTYITSGQVAYSNGSNLVGSAGFTYNGSTTFKMGANGGSVSISFPNSVSGFGSGISTLYASNQADVTFMNRTIRFNQNSIQMNPGGTVGVTIDAGNHSVSATNITMYSLSNATYSNRTGFLTSTPSYVVDINSTDALRLPRGTTAQRPTGALAILRGNTDNASIEWYNGTRWATGLESTFARGTSTYVPLFDANGQLTQDGGFRFNSSSVSLRVGDSPTTTKELTITRNVNSEVGIHVRNTNAGTGATTSYAVDNGDGVTSIAKRGTGASTYKILSPRDGVIYNTKANIVIFNDEPTGHINFGAGGTSSVQVQLRSNGNLLIGTTTDVSRTLHLLGTARITGSAGTATALMGRDANGDISNLTISSDLKLASGTLGLKRKSLIDSLSLASVAIDAAGNNLSLNSLGTLTIDFNATAGSIVSDGDITTIESDSEIHLRTAQDAKLDLTDEAKLSAPNLDGSNSFTVGYEGFYHNFVNTSAVTDSAFSIITDGDRKLLRAHGYGNGYVDATYTGEYPGKYILATTANHNVMDYRIDRDTLVVDANLSVGTLLYYTQNLHVNLRMTALAATNSTITFPDASDSFRGKSIYIRVLEKDPGIYVPVINVAGGVSRLLYTSTTTTAPSDQATLTMDNSTWPFFRTYKFTCLNTGTTPNYRWVLDQY